MPHAPHAHEPAAGPHAHELHYVPFQPQVPVDLPVQSPLRIPEAARLTLRFCGGTTFSRRVDGSVMAYQPASAYMPHVPCLIWRAGTWAAAPTVGVQTVPGQYHPWLPSMHPRLTAPATDYVMRCLSGLRLAVGGGGRVLKTAQRLVPLRQLLTGTLSDTVDATVHSSVHLTDGELRDGAPTRVNAASHWWQATNGVGPLMLSDVTEYVHESATPIALTITSATGVASSHAIAVHEAAELFLFHLPTELGGHGRPSNVGYHHRQAAVLFAPPVDPAAIPLLEAPTMVAEIATGDGVQAPCAPAGDVKALAIPPDTEFCYNAEY